MKVLVDSNILMLAEQSRIDLSEFKGMLAIPEPCHRELQMLAQFRGKRGRSARVALKIIEAYGIEVVKSEDDCDPSLLSIAKSRGWAVATNDRKLIKVLLDNRIEVLRVVGKRLTRGD